MWNGWKCRWRRGETLVWVGHMVTWKVNDLLCLTGKGPRPPNKPQLVANHRYVFKWRLNIKFNRKIDHESLSITNNESRLAEKVRNTLQWVRTLNMAARGKVTAERPNRKQLSASQHPMCTVCKLTSSQMSPGAAQKALFFLNKARRTSHLDAEQQDVSEWNRCSLTPLWCFLHLVPCLF